MSDKPESPDSHADTEPHVSLPSEEQEALEGLPAEQRRLVERLLLSYSGPLPPPHMLERYERLLPGAAARIFDMAENEQKHRHNWDTSSLQASVSSEKRGQYLGAATLVLLCVFAFAAGVFVTWQLGIAFLAVGVLGVIIRIVLGHGDLKKPQQSDPSMSSDS